MSEYLKPSNPEPQSTEDTPSLLDSQQPHADRDAASTIPAVNGFKKYRTSIERMRDDPNFAITVFLALKIGKST